MAKGRAPRVTVICEKCGILFHPWKATKPGRFCSRKCSPQGRKPSRPDCLCVQCGVLFRPVNNFSQKYCSRVCYRASGEMKHTLKNGYVIVYNKEHSVYKSGQIPEHRLIMEQHLGRRLEKHETVHHINTDRADNRLENLQLRIGKHGNGGVFKCIDCGSSNIMATEIATLE